MRAGGKAVTTVYGYDSEDKLVYFIVTDFDTNGTMTSVSGTWNGGEYLFTDGRVFLMSSASGTPTVTQLDLPVRRQAHKPELARLEEHEAILSFV